MNFEDFCKLPVRTGSSTVTRRFITPLFIENFDIHVCLIFSIKAPMVRFLNNRCEDICSGCRGRLPTGILIERGLVVMALQPSGFLRDGTGGSRCLWPRIFGQLWCKNIFVAWCYFRTIGIPKRWVGQNTLLIILRGSREPPFGCNTSDSCSCSSGCGTRRDVCWVLLIVGVDNHPMRLIHGLGFASFVDDILLGGHLYL